MKTAQKLKKLFEKNKVKTTAAPLEQIAGHQEAVLAGIGHALQTVGDKDDPGVAAFSCVITQSGEFVFFMHGALTYEVAPAAAALLSAKILEHTLGKRGKLSPMTQGVTGAAFAGGNKQYRKGVL